MRSPSLEMTCDCEKWSKAKVGTIALGPNLSSAFFINKNLSEPHHTHSTMAAFHTAKAKLSTCMAETAWPVRYYLAGHRKSLLPTLLEKSLHWVELMSSGFLKGEKTVETTGKCKICLCKNSRVVPIRWFRPDSNQKITCQSEIDPYGFWLLKIS